MRLTSSQSGYQLVNQSQRLAEQAAIDINAQTTQATPTGTSLPATQTELRASNNVSPMPSSDPLVNLQQASQYAKVGTSIIQREQDMIGTLLDTRV
jgi:hypothetical protein